MQVTGSGARPLKLARTALAAVVTMAIALAAAPAVAQTAAARNVNLSLSIPEGVTKVKAVIAFTERGLAGGWSNNAAFRDLAKRLEAGIVLVRGGDDLNDPSYPNRCASGEFNGIGEAMAKLATAAGKPELQHAPLIAVGHSHGGDYWNWYNACHPEKMALVFVHASGGVNYNGASLEVPVIYELGTGDLIENGSKKPRAGMFVNRNKGATMSLVIGQGEGHNNVTAQSLAMVIDIIEGIVKLRIPADADPAKGPVKLTRINEGVGWLGDLYTKEIAPFASFTGNKSLTAFLPTEAIAKKWKETGPGLPKDIQLPTDTCGWCGKPKDEPMGTASNGPVGTPVSPPPDAGAAADMAAPPPEIPPPPPSTPPSTPPPSTPPADAGAPPSTPTPPPAPPKPMTPAPDPVTPPNEIAGCAVGGGSPGGLLVLLGFAGVLLARRRRTRQSSDTQD